MAKPEAFAIKNWAKFQHYKDRNPPWIKLHVDIFASRDWVTLADASRLLAVVCMVVASRNNGQVPNDPDYIKRVAYLDRLPDLTPLIKCGFLINTLADASESNRSQADVRPEAEAYSTETEESHSPRAKGSRLAVTWKPVEKHHAIGRELSLTDGEVADAAQRFREYFHSPDAARPVKKDWDGAFTRWLRTDAPKIIGNRARASRTGSIRPGPGSIVDTVARLKANADLDGHRQSGDGMGREGNGLQTAGDDGTDQGEGFGNHSSVIDSDDAERMFRTARGGEVDHGLPTGAGSRPGSATEALSEKDAGLPGGRGAESSYDTGWTEQVVADLGRTQGTPGPAYSAADTAPERDDVGPMPNFLRRHPTAA